MDSQISPAEDDRKGERAVAVSAVQDEIETLSHTMRSTVGSGLVITALFVVGGMFMEQAGTLWFLGALWLLFIGRLGVINRTAGSELRIKESELALLTDAPGEEP